MCVSLFSFCVLGFRGSKFLVFVCICRSLENRESCVGKNWWHVVAAPHKKEKEKKDPTMASFAEAPAGDVAKGTLSCLREGVRAIWLRGRARVADKISSLY